MRPTPRPIPLNFFGIPFGLLGLADCWLVAASFGLAPTDKVGQYQGVFGVGATMADMLGPLVLTALVVGWRVPGWLVLGLVFVSCGLVMTPAVRWGERTREHTGDAVEAAT